MSFFGMEVDYKLHFFPALRAVVNVGYDQSNGGKNAPRCKQLPNNDGPFCTNEFSRSERKTNY
jgi:iron complex outermembrane receptor protein